MIQKSIQSSFQVFLRSNWIGNGEQQLPVKPCQLGSSSLLPTLLCPPFLCPSCCLGLCALGRSCFIHPWIIYSVAGPFHKLKSLRVLHCIACLNHQTEILKSESLFFLRVVSSQGRMRSSRFSRLIRHVNCALGWIALYLHWPHREPHETYVLPQASYIRWLQIDFVCYHDYRFFSSSALFIALIISVIVCVVSMTPLFDSKIQC